MEASATKRIGIEKAQNFMRQYRDPESRELKKLSAGQFMEVWAHYDKDGINFCTFIIILHHHLHTNLYLQFCMFFFLFVFIMMSLVVSLHDNRMDVLGMSFFQWFMLFFFIYFYIFTSVEH